MTTIKRNVIDNISNYLKLHYFDFLFLLKD